MKTIFLSCLACVLGWTVLSGCDSGNETASAPPPSVEYFGGVEAGFEPALKENLGKLMRAHPELAGIETVTWEKVQEVSFLGSTADQVIFTVTIDGNRYKGDATFIRGEEGPEFDSMNIDGPEGLRYVQA